MRTIAIDRVSAGCFASAHRQGASLWPDARHTHLLRILCHLLTGIFLLPGEGFSIQETKVIPVDHPKVAERQEARREVLARDRAAIEGLRRELETFRSEVTTKADVLQVGRVARSLLDKAKLDVGAIRLQQDDLREQVANAQRRVEELEAAMRALHSDEQLLQNPAVNSGDEASRSEQLAVTNLALRNHEINLEFEHQHLMNAKSRLEIGNERLAVAEEWLGRVEQTYRLQERQARQEESQDRIAELQQTLRNHRDRAATLMQHLDREREQLSEDARLALEQALQHVEEQAQLVELDIRLIQSDTTLDDLRDLIEDKAAKPQAINKGLATLATLEVELSANLKLLARKAELYDQHQRLSTQRDTASAVERQAQADEIDRWSALVVAVNERQRRVQAQLEGIEQFRPLLVTHYSDLLSQDLFRRAAIPSTAKGWRDLGTNMLAVPGILAHQVWLSLQATYQSVAQDQNRIRWVAFIGMEMGIIVLVIVARRRLIHMAVQLNNLDPKTFSSELGAVLAELGRCNALGGGLLLIVAVALWMFDVVQPGRNVILTLIMVLVGTKVAVNLAGLLLVSPHRQGEQQHTRSYQKWASALVIGGLLSGITVLVHLSAVERPVIDAFDRFYMLYWLLVTIPLLRARRHVVRALIQHYRGHFWLLSFRWLTLLMPLSIFGGALVGLTGYLNLAWAVAWYLMIFVVVLAVWLVIHGLLADGIAYLKNYAVAKANYGVLWTQEIIAPLHRTLSALLFLGAGVSLLLIFGWEGASPLQDADWSPMLVGVALALIVYELMFTLATYLVDRAQSAWGNALIRYARQPVRLILPLAVAQMLAPSLELPPDVLEPLVHVLVLAQIAAVSWLLVRLPQAGEEVIEQRYQVDEKDSFNARRVRTQFRMLRRMSVVVVYIIGIAAALMTFPTIRQLGAGLLASAGVAGLVVGVAARPFLQNLIAGIQVALTQPIRLGDLVVVKGESGRVAEINSTYVVVRIWDERRLIVPLNYFNTESFENWTRTSRDLLGTVYFYVDYSFPIEQGRTELKRILDESGLWDGRIWGFNVTDVTEQAVKVRAIVSAQDAAGAWKLRCHVREKFLEFLQEHYPQCLPKTRAVLDGAGFESPSDKMVTGASLMELSQREERR